MKRSFTSVFLIGVLLGTALGMGAFWMRGHYALKHVDGRKYTKSGSERPEYWLLPKDGTPAVLFGEKGWHVLDAPDSMVVCRRGEGPVTVAGYHFSDENLAPSGKDAEQLLATFQSPNAYTGSSMCIFNPGVLVRFTRGEDRLDLLVCFGCKDILWVLNGDETRRAPQVGLSELGEASLLTMLHRMYPNELAFKGGERPMK